MIRKIVTAICILFAALSLLGCFSSPAPQKSHLFGFTAMDMTDPAFRLAKTELEEALCQNGDRLITFDPQLDNDKQIQGIYNMLEQGIELLFLNPVDSGAILPALEECQRRQVKVICFDSKVTDDSYIETFVGSDNYKMGWLIGEYIRNEHPNGGRMAYLTNPQANSVQLREQGLLDALEGSHITVVAVGSISLYEEVLPATEHLLEEYEDLDILWGFNDEISMMMHSCILAHGLQDQILLYGTGASDIQNAVKKGDVQAASIQSPADWGRVCAELCYKILDGEKVTSDYLLETFIIDTGSVDNDEMEP